MKKHNLVEPVPFLEPIEEVSEGSNKNTKKYIIFSEFNIVKNNVLKTINLSLNNLDIKFVESIS